MVVRQTWMWAAWLEELAAPCRRLCETGSTSSSGARTAGDELRRLPHRKNSHGGFRSRGGDATLLPLWRFSRLERVDSRERRLSLRSVKRLAELFAEPAIDSLTIGEAGVIGNHLPEGGKGGLAVQPRILRPQVGAHQGLGALEDTSSTSTRSPLRGRRLLTASGLEERRVRAEGRPAIEAKRLVHARDQKQHSHPGILQDVRQRVRAVVAAAVRKQDGVVVEDRDEARRVAARRAVDPPVGSGRREDDEWGELDEGAGSASRGDRATS